MPQERPGDVPETLLAVDGTGLLVRTLRASQGVGLTHNGEPTAAVMMFVNSLARRLQVLRPSHVVIAWDGPRSREWRRELFPGYKAHRPDQHDHPVEQTGQYLFCHVAGMRQIMVPGFEADDILAAVCRQAALEMPRSEIYLASDDTDMLQLLNGSAVVAVPLTGECTITTAGDVEREWGVPPADLPSVRALAGDPSDGIPGLPGIGPKKAVRMVLDSGGKWPLPESVLPDPNDRILAVLCRNIIDLARPPRLPEQETGTDHFRLGETARWHPGEASVSIQDFLDTYGFARISERALRGDLW